MHAVQRSFFSGTEGDHCVKSLEENEKTDLGCRLGTLCSKAGADQAGRFASKPSHHIAVLCNLIKLAFLEALTVTGDFTDNTKFNKRRSRIEAAQNCAMK